MRTHGLTTGPGGENVATRSKDVDNAAVVGERGASVAGGGGTDSAGGGSRGGGVVVGIVVAVTSGDGEEDAASDEVLGSLVQGSGVATTEGHVDESTVGAAAASGITGDEVNTGDDTSVGTRAVVTEDLDTVDGGVLGDTVRGRADGTGAVGAVAVGIAVDATSEVGNEGSTTGEVLKSVCQCFELHRGSGV